MPFDLHGRRLLVVGQLGDARAELREALARAGVTTDEVAGELGARQHLRQGGHADVAVLVDPSPELTAWLREEQPLVRLVIVADRAERDPAERGDRELQTPVAATPLLAAIIDALAADHRPTTRMGKLARKPRSRPR